MQLAVLVNPSSMLGQGGVSDTSRCVVGGVRPTEPRYATDLIDVLDHVVTEFDVSRIARTDEIDGAPSYLVGGSFDAWARALHALIGDAILVSAEDQPVWIHVVATRRDITLWIRDDGWGLSASDLDAQIEGPAFASVRAAVASAGGELHVESAGTWRGSTVRMVLPIVKPAALPTPATVADTTRRAA